MKFKKGDRVHHKQYGDGTVLGISTPTQAVGVEFDEAPKDGSGHRCSGHSSTVSMGKSFHCRWMFPDNGRPDRHITLLKGETNSTPSGINIHNVI